MDSLSALLPRFGFNANVFFSGEFCGVTHFNEGEQVGHLHFVRAGEIVMEHCDTPHLEIRTPSLVLYPRPFDHRLVVSPTSPASLLCATLSFKEAQRNPFAMALPDVMVIPLAALSGLETALALLFGEAAQSYSGRKIVMDRLCDILIVQVIRYALEENLVKAGVLNGLSDRAVSVVLSAIHDQPSRAWLLEDMAALACMSRTKFANHFKQVTGKTPGEYLLEWRMALADNLLRERRSVKEVGLAVGYSDQPAFSRAFTAHFGMSPTEWMRKSDEAEPGV